MARKRFVVHGCAAYVGDRDRAGYAPAQNHTPRATALGSNAVVVYPGEARQGEDQYIARDQAFVPSAEPYSYAANDDNDNDNLLRTVSAQRGRGPETSDAPCAAHHRYHVVARESLDAVRATPAWRAAWQAPESDAAVGRTEFDGVAG